MKEYINRLARGKYTYKVPKLIAVDGSIDIKVTEKEVSEYELKLSADEPVKGIVYSSNPKVTVVDNGFSGKEMTIRYKVDAVGLEPGAIIEGRFDIVSSAGEMDVSFIFHIVEQSFETSIGKAFNMFHFVNLVKESPEEAVRVFTSDRFADVFIRQDDNLRNTYISLLDKNNIYTSMEEFILVLRKKTQVSLEINDNRRIFEDFSENVKESIEIIRKGWGFFTLEVYTDAPFIKLSTAKIASDEFTGGKYELEYLLDNSRMHAGRNYGKIYIKNFHENFKVEIEVCNTAYAPEVINDKLFPENSQEIKRAQSGLTLSYLDFRLKKADVNTWISKSNQILDRVRGIVKPNPYFDLLQAQMYLTERREEEGKWIINHLKEVVMNNIDSHVELYCYYLYVNSLLINTVEYTEEAVKTVTKYYENGYDSWKLLWILFYLKGEQDKNLSVKLIRLKESFHNGCTSPVMYFEASAILNNQPQLLRVLNKFEMQIVLFGCRHKMINEKLAVQISTVIGNENVATDKSIGVLKYLYSQYNNDEILTALVTHMIRNAYFGEGCFEYYEKGVLRGLRITRLYEYYLASLNRDYGKRLPKVVLMYFDFDNQLDYELTAYLYANIIKNKDMYGNVYSTYEKNIEVFVYEQLKAGHIDESLMILYRKLWKSQLIGKDTVGYMAELLFTHKLTCFDEGVSAVLVKHKEQKEPVRYQLRDNKVFIPMYTEGCSVVFLCNDGVIRKDSVNYEVEKIFEDMPLLDEILAMEEGNTGIELYRARNYAMRGKFTPEAVLSWFKIADNSSMNEGFKKLVNSWIIHFYYEYYTGDDFKNIYEQLDKNKLGAAQSKEIIETCINFGLYSEAYGLVNVYGFEQVSASKLFRLVKYMSGVQLSEYDELLVKIGSHVFINRVYDEDVLEYMMNYFNGTNDEMYQMWKACLNFSMNVSNLSERVIAQMLFTGEHTGRMTEIFTYYYSKGARNNVVQAYISYNSYLYLIQKKKANDIVFKAIEGSFEDKRELPDTCYLAWLKHMTEVKPEQFVEERKKLAQEILNILCKEDKIYSFFKKFNGVLDIPYNAMDKTVIEYIANPDCKVEIHYTYGNDETGEYVTDVMKCSAGGIFTKCFTLFYGDKITYYFTVKGSGHDIITEKFSHEISELNTEQSESRFDYVNDCLASRELHDMVTMKKMMHSYCVQDYVTKQIFRPMKG